MSIRAICFGFIFNLIAIVACSAAIVTIDFTATQRSVRNTAGLPAGSFVNQAVPIQTITGMIRYDTSQQLSFSDPRGIFVYSAGGVDILLDQFSTANPDFQSQLIVINDLAANGSDQFGATDSSPQIGTDPAGFYNTILFDFFDPTGTAFSDGSIPAGLQLSDFVAATISLRTFIFDGINIPVVATANYRITQLGGVSDVPLPAALPLFLVGLAGLGAARRRTKSSIGI